MCHCEREVQLDNTKQLREWGELEKFNLDLLAKLLLRVAVAAAATAGPSSSTCES